MITIINASLSIVIQQLASIEKHVTITKYLIGVAKKLGIVRSHLSPIRPLATFLPLLGVVLEHDVTHVPGEEGKVGIGNLQLEWPC